MIKKKSNVELSKKADRLWQKANQYITEMNEVMFDEPIPEKYSTKGERLLRRAIAITYRYRMDV
jgi:hypothetical protein